MNSSPTSFVVLFFIVSLFHQLPCDLSKQGLGWCENLFQCGDITAGYPFWGGNRLKPCGHPLLELHCNKNATSLIMSNQEYHVLQIDQPSYTLRLARSDLLGPFCSAKFTTTTYFPEVFESRGAYKSLIVYYFCDPRLNYVSSFTCPDWGLVSISQNPDYQYSCQNSFTVHVPESFVPNENKLNLTSHLEAVLREGFELGVPTAYYPCQECLSSGGTCGFDGSKQVCCKETLASGVQCEIPYSLDDETFLLCNAQFSCGNQEYTLSYPFWVPGREECGHPDFKLNCSRGFPEFNIASMKFTILKSGLHKASVARSDYISNVCTLDPVDVPFNWSVLPLSPDTELLTLYYDCPYTDLPSYVESLGCVNHGYSYYVTKNISSLPLTAELKNMQLLCKRNVTIPASGPALITLKRDPTLPNLRKAIEQGFVLGVDSDCSTCDDSWGVCGYSQISNRFVCRCMNGSQGDCRGPIEIIDRGDFSGAETGSVTCVILFALLVSLIPHFLRLHEKKTLENLRQTELMAHIPLQRYSFAQAKTITNSFAEEIGKGGFGTVYKGTLSDGRMVAVKVLKDAKGKGEDFINEVASMSRTSHVNIVSLLGFCFEGSKRAIIYEFVENGSLDKYLSSNISVAMDWKALYEIALGVARGLEYLHHGCKTRIIHFDIKPHNVLLDDSLCAKVSDFGLARLCEKKEDKLTILETRGTVGYTAPEVVSRAYGDVSHKSDVYSYGMLVLEMIGTRNKERAGQELGSNVGSMSFPDWVYKDLEKGKYGNLSGNEISSEEEEIAKKMTLVGLWCIQYSPTDRPPMNRVVEMMEGNVDALEVPPSSFLKDIRAAPLSESTPLLEKSSRTSNTSEVMWSAQQRF
ncbi:unnamed protein product [Microthlaspi erraticum]|uniref:non-specific serine/threonine protein kinase n=1 Tax=Microthlaspi erraticum TaxID=1685480 RepID=A0A6D2IX41_9BRAS|nr:unnamed protein product [Microthlaspi erraticum]